MPSRGRPTPALTLLIAAVYLAAAKLGLSMAVVAEQVTAVWPPTGIALAAMLVLGRRAWPGILLGAFVANVTRHEPAWTAAGIAAGNTLEALLGAWLLGRVGFRRSMTRLRDVLALLVLAAGGSTIASATIGVTSLCLGGVHPWTAFPALWSTWWIGDLIGAVVMAPFLLTWTSPQPELRHDTSAAEAALLAAGTAVTSVLVFAQPGVSLSGYPLHYAIFPFVIWAALRFGQRGTSAVTFIGSAVAIWSTVTGRGPFALATPHESLLMLQMYTAIVAVTGLLLGAAIAERDAAERRAAADYENLRVGEERLRVALEAGRMGVWDWNVGTGEVKWSDTLEPLHGLPRGSFSGTLEGFQTLVHPEDREAVDRAITSAVETGTGYDIEFRNVWPDGSVHWMAAKGHVVRDEANRPLRMIGVGMDVTARRQLAEELAQRAEALADADRRKDEFLAMLAHELRNPLAPLGTALHLIRVDDGSRERFLEMAERQVRQLVRLVDDLLDVSRITQGKITLRRERVALADLVERAVEMVRSQIESRGHAFTLSLPAAPVELDVDPTRIAQVLGNLLSNAAKYTPPGGSIFLTAERIADELQIRVRDTGAGLSPELVPHVFDLFVQGDASLDRPRGGLGIGLTIVRRLIELHGGRVEARSAGPGHGSEFIVHLRALPVPFAGARDPAAERPPAVAAALRVLVVEDNADTAESLAAMLRLWGHEPRIAYDGMAALEALEEFAPDVVLSDIGLPGMDGYALARELRARPASAGAVLIALSGYGRDADKRRALDAGFDHHLVKPPDFDALAGILGHVAVRSSEGRARVLH